MNSAATIEYPAGFSFAEKKGYKDYENYYNNGLKAIQDKLGADWQVQIDWAAFEPVLQKGDRSTAGAYLYKNYVYGAIAHEVKLWTDLFPAVNEKVTGKKWKLFPQEVQGTGGYNLVVGSDAIEVGISPAKLSYAPEFGTNKNFTKRVEEQL